MNESISGSTTEKYQYTGKERDKETGLDYFGARYYDSDLGVWSSVDPLLDLSHGISPYAYCYNDPLKYVDPSGCYPWDEKGWIYDPKIGAWVKDYDRSNTSTYTAIKAYGFNSTGSEVSEDNNVEQSKGVYRFK